MPHFRGDGHYRPRPDKYKHKKPKSRNPWSPNYDDSPEKEDTTLFMQQDYSQGYINPYVNTPDAPVFDTPSAQDNAENLQNFMNNNKPPHLQNRWKQQPSSFAFSQPFEKCGCEPKQEEEFEFDLGPDWELPHSKVGQNTQKGNFDEFIAERPWEKRAAEARERADKIVGKLFQRQGKSTNIIVCITDPVIANTQNDKTKPAVWTVTHPANTQTLVGGWVVFQVKSLDDILFLNYIQKNNYDNLVIITHGGSDYTELGGITLESQGSILMKIDFGKDGKTPKNFPITSDSLGKFVNKHYPQWQEDPGEGRTPASWDEPVSSDKAGKLFQQIFKASKPTASIIFDACETVAKDRHLSEILPYFAVEVKQLKKICLYFSYGAVEFLKYSDGTKIPHFDKKIPISDIEGQDWNPANLGWLRKTVEVINDKIAFSSDNIKDLKIMKKGSISEVSLPMSIH